MHVEYKVKLFVFKFCTSYRSGNASDETVVDIDSFFLETNLQTARNKGSKREHLRNYFICNKMTVRMTTVIFTKEPFTLLNVEV
jgi:hypothetical protein